MCRHLFNMSYNEACFVQVGHIGVHSRLGLIILFRHAYLSLSMPTRPPYNAIAQAMLDSDLSNTVSITEFMDGVRKSSTSLDEVTR